MFNLQQTLHQCLPGGYAMSEFFCKILMMFRSLDGRCWQWCGIHRWIKDWSLLLATFGVHCALMAPLLWQASGLCVSGCLWPSVISESGGLASQGIEAVRISCLACRASFQLQTHPVFAFNKGLYLRCSPPSRLGLELTSRDEPTRIDVQKRWDLSLCCLP